MCGPPLLPVEAMAAVVEGGAESRWESLPPELLCLVLARLPLSSLVRSALVCKRWRQAAAEAYDDDGHRSRSLPWLWGTDSRDFHSLPDHRSYRLDMPEEILEGPPDDAAGVDAIHEDWFVVTTSTSAVAVDDAAKNKPYLYFLYNPFSRQRIDLPPVHTHAPRRHFNEPRPRFAFSRNPGDPGCVAAFFRHPKEGVGFCSILGGNVVGGWKMIPCLNNVTTYGSIAFHNGLVCLATHRGNLHVADTVSLEIRTALAPPPSQNLPHRLSIDVPDHYRGVRKYTLRVAAGGLLMVCYMPIPSSRRTPIAIYRANFELGRWEMLQSLGGQAMLLGPLSLFSVRLSPKLPSSSCGLKGDCIYLLGGAHSVRKLRLAEQSCRTFNLVEEKLGRGRSDFRPSSFRDRSFLMLSPPKPKFDGC